MSELVSFFTMDEYGKSQCVYHATDVDILVKENERLRATLAEAMELLRQTTFDSGAISAAEWEQRYAGLLALSPVETPARCNCGAHEWPADCVQIEDSRGRLHTIRGCQPGAPNSAQKPSGTCMACGGLGYIDVPGNPCDCASPG